MPLTKYMTN